MKNTQLTAIFVVVLSCFPMNMFASELEGVLSDAAKYGYAVASSEADNVKRNALIENRHVLASHQAVAETLARDGRYAEIGRLDGLAELFHQSTLNYAEGLRRKTLIDYLKKIRKNEKDPSILYAIDNRIYQLNMDPDILSNLEQTYKKNKRRYLDAQYAIETRQPI